MGKGVPAALLAANLKACLRGQLQSGVATPQEVVTGVNRLFWEVSPQGLFASLFFGVFDLRRGVLEYVNAGHDYPFQIGPEGSSVDLVTGGTVLGLMEHARYESGQVRLSSGDRVVFYSDGVTDRANRDGEAYGVERLKQVASRVRGDRARLALYTLLGEVQGWSGGQPADDDMTLVVARIK
jgi:sigma-B regulation protein RsbU (phosphoserine phosphatase)